MFILWKQAQVVLLAILTVAIMNYFVGLFIPPSVEQMSRGFLGFNGEYVFRSHSNAHACLQ